MKVRCAMPMDMNTKNYDSEWYSWVEMTLSVKNRERRWLKVPEWICTMALNAKTKKRWCLKIKQDSTMQARVGGEQDSTQYDKTMTNRYRCGLDSNWTQTNRNMADRYRWGPKTPTQTGKMMADRYRCGPDSNWTQNDRKMAGQYRCGPENPN